MMSVCSRVFEFSMRIFMIGEFSEYCIWFLCLYLVFVFVYRLVGNSMEFLRGRGGFFGGFVVMRMCCVGGCDLWFLRLVNWLG